MTSVPADARVFVARRLPDNGPLLLRQAGLDVTIFDSERPPSRDRLLAAVAGVHGIVSLLSDRIDEELLDAAGPQLRVVANYAVGYDNIDVSACARRGVVVANTPDVLTDATADQAMMLLLAVARRAREGHELVAAGNWQGWHPLQLLGKEIAGATLGIVGLGRIGSAVARRARAFGMGVIYHNRSPVRGLAAELSAEYRKHLDDLLRESDFVSLHAPLTERTRHLIDARALANMRTDSVLINTARGPLVDEAALVEALASGRLGGAGLDVFEREPTITPGLEKLRNVVLAPHLGSATTRTRQEMARLCAEAVLAVLSGERPHNEVVPD